MKRIVLKLGGSHLTSRDWPQKFCKLVEQLGVNEFFLIIGGGEAIEAMRELDRVHSLDEWQMHWRCVWMLRATTDVAYELLQRSHCSIPVNRIATTSEFLGLINGTAKHAISVIDSSAFYSPTSESISQELLAFPRPASGWSTTTDAIAIYCACLLQADQCILLKSCFIEPGLTIEQAAEQGIVDSECPNIAKQFSNVQLLQL